MQIWLDGNLTTSDDILRHNECLDVICAVADLVAGRKTTVTLGGGASCESTMTTATLGSVLASQTRCSVCGGSNVQRATWVSPNTLEVHDDFSGPGDTWCEDCSENHDLVSAPSFCGSLANVPEEHMVEAEDHRASRV
jgi:hypothetical protein